MRPFAALVLATGCARGPAANGPWAGRIDTLPSGTVVVHNPAAGLWDSSAAWRLVEDLRIGSVDGDPHETFAQIRDLAVDAAGRIYVLDGQLQEIRVFDGAGRYVRTLGRNGEGPGEFRGAFGLAFDKAQRLWVMDHRLRRYSVFDTTGTYLTSFPRPTTMYGWRWGGAFLDNGSLYDLSARLNETRDEVLVRFDSTMPELVDTVEARRPSTPSSFYDLRDERGFGSVISVPFMPQVTRAVDAAGFFWTGYGDRYEFTKVAFSGDTAMIVMAGGAPAPVSDAERETELAPIRKTAGPKRIDESRVPTHKPYFDRLQPDGDGYLWVGRPAAEGAAAGYDVFDAEGRFFGWVRSPVPVSPDAPLLIRHDAVYGVTRDALDVQYVVRMAIRGR